MIVKGEKVMKVVEKESSGKRSKGKIFVANK